MSSSEQSGGRKVDGGGCVRSFMLAIGTTEREEPRAYILQAREYLPLTKLAKLSIDQFGKVTAGWRMYARFCIRVIYRASRVNRHA